MIINTGQRTDIPAFYAKWFANRLREGIVCVRNPFNPGQVSRYRLDPSVVDVIGFCTKNPAPMFPYMDLLRDYGQYWYVSITPYGRDIEPNVPDKHRLLEDFRKLSDMVGTHSIGWRYDPILLSDRYTMEYQIHAFDQIASALDGYTQTVVISFIDLYPKVRRNFPEAREVTKAQRLALGKEIIQIASAHGMTVNGRHLHVPKRDPRGQNAPATLHAISAPIIPAGICANIAMQMRSRTGFWPIVGSTIRIHRFSSAIIWRGTKSMTFRRSPGLTGR